MQFNIICCQIFGSLCQDDIWQPPTIDPTFLILLQPVACNTGYNIVQLLLNWILEKMSSSDMGAIEMLLTGLFWEILTDRPTNNVGSYN